MRITFFFRFLFFLIFQSLKEKFTEQKKDFGSMKTKYWPKRYRMVNTSSEFKLFFSCTILDNRYDYYYH